MNVVHLNGRLLPEAEARISPTDRGFLFGDGVYEVVRVVEGAPFLADAHLARLGRGLRELRIPAPAVADDDRFAELCGRLLDANGLRAGQATVYLQVTRGAAPRTHAFPDPPAEPTVFAAAAPFSPSPALREGVRAATHPDLRWARCDVKTVNLLPNVMAKQRARERGCWEALLLRGDVVTEGSSSNAFGVVGGELRTHPGDERILPGVTRALVIEMARETGIPVNETPILRGELERLDELFLTGTTTDVQPVVELDGRPVGDGRTGPVARALREALYRRMGVATVGGAA